MYIAAAMAVGSLIQANESRNAQMKAKAADAKLQRAKLERARGRATDDYVENSQRMRESTQRREIQIEENRISGASRVDASFAGSGISGQSVDEIDNELEMSAAKNKHDNDMALDQQLADSARNFNQTMDDSAFAERSIDTTAVKGSFLGDTMGAVNAAGAGANLSSSLGL